MQWKDKMMNDVFEELESGLKNLSISKEMIESGAIGAHLAVFTEPFLTLILEGKKTIESRFSKNRCSPHGKIYSGDLVFLKKTAGPVLGIFIAGKISFFPKLDRSILEKIQYEYHDKICASADPDFWEKRINSQVATLMEIKQIFKITPLKVYKTDRRGWVVLKSKDINLKLDIKE